MAQVLLSIALRRDVLQNKKTSITAGCFSNSNGGVIVKTLICSAIFAFASSVPAAAQDFPGGHIEAMVGYDSMRGVITYKDSAVPEDNFAVDESTNGVVFSIAAGYDVRISRNLFAGVEGSFDLADNQRCTEVYGNDAACFDVGNNFAVGGRLGTRLGSNAMFFVGAAYVNGEAEISYEDDLDPSYNFSESDNRGGYRLSAGLEHRLTGMVFGKVEYRYSDYGDYNYEYGTETVDLGFDRHQVLAGVGMRF